MVDQGPQTEEQVARNGTAPSMQQNYFTILTNVISDVSRDPAQLRKLVYALARHKAEALLSLTAQDDPLNTQMLLKLEHALELEQAIERIEAIAGGNHSAVQDGVEDPDPDIFDRSQSKALASPDRPTALAIIIPPAEAPIRLPQSFGMLADEQPHWSDRTAAMPQQPDHAPKETSRWIRPGILSFLQLTAAVVFGVALYIGVSGWVQLRQHQSIAMPAQLTPAPAPVAPAVQTASAAPVTHVVAAPQPVAPVAPPPPPKPTFPFPLPTSFGVYAVNGQALVELKKLPIKIPDARVLVSAEISEPSQAVVQSGDPTFVVFRRDLVNSAPSVASVRVVARVTREMKFVDGKPTYAALPHSWRIRAKSFDFVVAPVEGRPEMIFIKPASGVDLPAGRYALALDGYGYDFAIDGNVQSPDQCLEQVQVMNGSVLSPCSKS